MSEKAQIELYVIEKVKEMRTEKGFTQASLAEALGYSEGFIGHIENPKRRDKYNIKHLNEIAKLFGCSIRDFFPESPI